MLRSVKELGEYKFHAPDGEIGEVNDLYLDIWAWQVRYFVASGGGWLSDRQLLLSPYEFQEIEPEEKVIHVASTLEKLAQSPQLPLDTSLSAEYERQLHEYYRWPFYWEVMNDDALGVGNLARVPLVELAEEMEAERREAGGTEADEVRLRSVRQLLGYAVQAREGPFGSVVDMILEDQAWNVAYLVVDTGGWLSGRKVLISPSWVEDVDWAERVFVAGLKQETIANSPEYDPDVPLDSEYETRLYRHYGRDEYDS